MTPLAPGLGAMRERAAFIDVGFPDAELESVSDLQLFAGANTVAVQVEGGGWEILQYQDAEEIRPAVWRLSRLIRGQAGTEDLMRSGAPVGAMAVLLDDSVKPAGLRAGEAGLELSWRSRALVGFGTSADATVISAAGGLRALTPLSPVHLRAMRMEDGGVRFSWTRRSRLRADGWDEVPLAEERESYRIVLTDGTDAALNPCNRRCVHHHLQHPHLITSRQALVRAHLEVEVGIFPHHIHDPDQLER